MMLLDLILGILVILMGAYPFLDTALPNVWKVIPSSGGGYSIIILVLGVLITINAIKHRRHRLIR